jgi:hypothetical protein
MGLSFFYLLKAERGGVLIDFKFLCDHDNGLI